MNQLSNPPSEVLEVHRQQLRPEADYCAAAEASTLGLPPGVWPQIIEVPARDGRRINFHFEALAYDNGDVSFARYTAHGGHLVLTIYND